MRHRKRKFTLDRTAAQRRALARMLLTSFVERGRLETSAAKAHYLRSLVEPLVTTAKTGSLSARRRVIATLANAEAAADLLKRAEQYKDRPGGYTRLTRLPSRRAGDGTAMVVIEWT